MRWIIKIILFPISLVLSILTAFLTFLLGIGTALLYLLMMFCIFGAIASFLQKEVTIGIEALIIGFLVSPYGIPMVGATVIAFLQGIKADIFGDGFLVNYINAMILSSEVLCARNSFSQHKKYIKETMVNYIVDIDKR